MRVQAVTTASGATMTASGATMTASGGRQPPEAICIAFLLTIILAGCGAPAAANHNQAAAAPAMGAQEVVLSGLPVRKTLTLMSAQPGARIEAIEQTPLHSKLAGYVERVLVDYGDVVKAGQPLVKLAVPEMEVEVLQKQALIDQAQSEVAQAEAAKVAADSAVTTARAKVAENESRLVRTAADRQRWQLQRERYKQLADSGSVTKQLVEEAEQNYQAAAAADLEAKAATDAVKAAVAQAEAGVDKARADIAAAQARLRVAQANLQYSRTMLAYAQITAPFAGVITRRGVDPGHYVQPAGSSASPLLIVARTDVIRVFVAVPGPEARYVDVGDEVTLEVQSLGGAPFEGKVTRTSYSLDEANFSLETIIDIDNKDGALRPGMYATAKLKLDEHKDALSLPSAAVVRQDRAAFCYRLIDGKAVKTPIQLGLRVGDDFEVTSGLSDNDQVILNKAASLKDGQSVEATKPPPPAK